MARTRALITGISGQDGWYLAHHLDSLGHAIQGTSHKIARRSEFRMRDCTVPLLPLDITDQHAVATIVSEGQFDTIYNLAGWTSSATTDLDPLRHINVNGLPVRSFLEAIRESSPHTRFLQASSSEIFAGIRISPQDEQTQRSPTNPYGVAKALADQLVAMYRHEHDMFAVSAILYTHESPRRPIQFVTRKIANAAARIRNGDMTPVSLRSLSAVRDWGHANDYTDCMVSMLAADTPDDYIVATGTPHTVWDICVVAFGHVGLDPSDHVASSEISDPQELCPRVGDASKARRVLGWSPRYTFEEMVIEMVEHDLHMLSTA